MSCIFSVIGRNLDVDKIVTSIKIEPFSLKRKGKPAFENMPEGKQSERSGLSFFASNADFNNFRVQVEDAIKFLEDNIDDIKKITSNYGIEFSTLDFGVTSTLNQDKVVQSFYFPINLIELASKLNISIQLSTYIKTAENS